MGDTADNSKCFGIMPKPLEEEQPSQLSHVNNRQLRKQDLVSGVLREKSLHPVSWHHPDSLVTTRKV